MTIVPFSDEQKYNFSDLFPPSNYYYSSNYNSPGLILQICLEVILDPIFEWTYLLESTLALDATT